MKEWDSLGPREMWDFIDGVYLKHQLQLEELMDYLNMEYEKYFQMRKEVAPLPSVKISKFLSRFGDELKKEPAKEGCE